MAAEPFWPTYLQTCLQKSLSLPTYPHAVKVTVYTPENGRSFSFFIMQTCRYSYCSKIVRQRIKTGFRFLFSEKNIPFSIKFDYLYNSAAGPLLGGQFIGRWIHRVVGFLCSSDFSDSKNKFDSVWGKYPPFYQYHITKRSESPTFFLKWSIMLVLCCFLFLDDVSCGLMVRTLLGFKALACVISHL